MENKISFFHGATHSVVVQVPTVIDLNTYTAKMHVRKGETLLKAYDEQHGIVKAGQVLTINIGKADFKEPGQYRYQLMFELGEQVLKSEIHEFEVKAAVVR